MPASIPVSVVDGLLFGRCIIFTTVIKEIDFYLHIFLSQYQNNLIANTNCPKVYSTIKYCPILAQNDTEVIKELATEAHPSENYPAADVMSVLVDLPPNHGIDDCTSRPGFTDHLALYYEHLVVVLMKHSGMFSRRRIEKPDACAPLVIASALPLPEK